MYGKAKKGEAHGPGGLKAAMSRAANSFSSVNDAPDGPYAHFLGMTDDAGMHGDTSVGGKNGTTFYFND